MYWVSTVFQSWLNPITHFESFWYNQAVFAARRTEEAAGPEAQGPQRRLHMRDKSLLFIFVLFWGKRNQNRKSSSVEVSREERKAIRFATPPKDCGESTNRSVLKSNRKIMIYYSHLIQLNVTLRYLRKGT